MRTHCPGILHQVCPPASFPFRVVGVCHLRFGISKEKEHMEKEIAGTAAAVPNNEQSLSSGSKCPVMNGARRHTVAGAPTNANWWPDQLNLKILHQHSPLSDPMDKEF